MLLEFLVPKRYRANKKLRKERLKKCLACEDLILLNQCRHCLCFVNEKVVLKSEHCAKPKPEERKW